MKPICVPCQRFFRPKQNGFPFIEGMSVGPSRAAPGTAEPEKWKPYKLWIGDLWECHGCGTTIVVGTGKDRVAEYYQADFAQVVSNFKPKLQVNDC